MRERELPLPQTQLAILPSAGVPRATIHHFDHAEDVTTDDDCDARGRLYRRSFLFWFRCEETGALRVWGTTTQKVTIQ